MCACLKYFNLHAQTQCMGKKIQKLQPQISLTLYTAILISLITINQFKINSHMSFFAEATRKTGGLTTNFNK